MTPMLQSFIGKKMVGKNMHSNRFPSFCLSCFCRFIQCVAFLASSTALFSAEPFLEKTNLFEEEKDGFRLYRIPGIIVTAKGSVLAYCEARKFTVADRGEIEIHLRRSTDGGRTWSPAKQVAILVRACRATPTCRK